MRLEMQLLASVGHVYLYSPKSSRTLLSSMMLLQNQGTAVPFSFWHSQQTSLAVQIEAMDSGDYQQLQGKYMAAFGRELLAVPPDEHPDSTRCLVRFAASSENHAAIAGTALSSDAL